MATEEIDTARSVLSISGTIVSLVTTGLLVFAFASVSRNRARTDVARMRLTVGASVAALVLMVVVAGAMVPTLWQNVITDRSQFGAELALFVAVFVIVLGLLVASIVALRQSWRGLQEAKEFERPGADRP